MDKPSSIKGLITSLHRGGAERKSIYLLCNGVISELFLLENKIEYDIKPDKIKFIKSLLAKENVKSPFLKYLLVPYYSFKLSNQISGGSRVISFVERADMVNVFSKIFFKHKSIVTVLTDPKGAYRGFRYPLYYLMRLVYVFSDMIVVNSKGMAEFLRKSIFLKNKVFSVYNPISIDFVEEKIQESLSDEENNIFNNYPVFITVSRLTEAKCQWQLLRIFRQIKINIPNSKLVIIGDGRLKKYLTGMSKDLGFKTFINGENTKIDDSFDVYFLGSKENPFKYISQSSIFIFPSLFEGFSNVILEALACGIPVVSSDCSYGPREVLSPETDINKRTKIPEFAKYGILMPVFSADKKSYNDLISAEELVWANTITELYYDNNSKQNYINGSKIRAKEFDVGVIIPEWNKVLNNKNI